MREVQAMVSEEIHLGRRGENLATCVTFDVSEWQGAGEGTVHLLHQRNGDEYPYPCAITVENGVVTWIITAADVEFAGRGKAELQYLDGEVCIKSAVFVTKTLRALGKAGEVPPDPEENWVNQVLEAAGSAEAAVGKTSYIGANGNWYEWDAEEGDFVDTGVKARGPKGDKGETGVSGVYVGAGEMPDGYNVQIDPDGSETDLADLVAQRIIDSGELDDVLVENAASKGYVDEKIAGIPTPDVSGQIETHNTDDAAHADIRAALNGKAPMYTYGTEDLEAGITPLESGRLHFVYE